MKRKFTGIYDRFMEEFMGKFNFRKNEPMKNHTSLKVGGDADLFISPLSVDELKQLVSGAEKYKIPVTFIGSGTNILVKDNGIRGLVICLGGIKGKIETVQEDKTNVSVTAYSGHLLSSLGRFALEKGLEGLNFTAGIPGTVAGAVMMNSSADKGKISDVISCLEVLVPGAGVKILGKKDIVFSSNGLVSKAYEVENSYKQVVLKATFKLKKGDKKKLRAQWNEILNKRNSSQPVSLPSAGCFFKNPEPGISAGMLIDRAGLKGERCGNAMVSEKHANFIVNLGGARAIDILRLKKRVEEKVFDFFSIHLETEVKIEGE